MTSTFYAKIRLNENFSPRDKIADVREIQFSADDLTAALLNLSERETVCLLDSGGVSYADSRFLIAGIKPLELFEINFDNAAETLAALDEKFSNPNVAYIFTLSYDFGLKLEKIKPRAKEFQTFDEPDVFAAAFDCLIVHDYETKKSFLTGDEPRFDEIENALIKGVKNERSEPIFADGKSSISSNFTREKYVAAVEEIQERIRRGDTYQANLTQQFRARLPETLTAQAAFRQLRQHHPAPFAAFLKRTNDTVVSISPERFFKIENQTADAKRTISAAPIKGTRRRGASENEDEILRDELLNSAKDLAENTMIVDLLRNDLGRICEFGSIKVEKLCALETHPTLFHLVSTIKGDLREIVKFSDVIRAVFPCGSITGAPKISTMRIIDEIETAGRGLSMGAIGFSVQSSKFELQSSINLSVAIRTMTIRDGEAIFNVGGGIVIDSVPEAEYAESLLKAKALLNALNAD